MPRFLAPIIVFALAAAALAAVAGAWQWHRYQSEPLALAQAPVRVEIPRGASVAAIGRRLADAGVDVAPWQVLVAARLRGDAGQLQAGVYELREPQTLRTLLDRLARGDVLQVQVQLIEGWTFAQMREALARQPDLRQDSAGLTERELLARIGAQETRAEGLFFPSTYSFAVGTSDLDIYRQSYRLMRRALDDVWSRRPADSPLSDPYALLTLASIVEKETGQPADRSKVAAVFLNRLRIGMRLQSDPTTIYGLGSQFDGNLRRRDLLADTAWNTYTRAGLPPTPIALPGRASLEAVIAPAAIPALYFVARGDGSSEFSDTLDAHNRAVARFQLGGAARAAAGR